MTSVEQSPMGMMMPIMMMVVMLSILPSIVPSTTTPPPPEPEPEPEPDPEPGDAGVLSFNIRDEDGNIIWPVAGAAAAQIAPVELIPEQVYSVTDVVATNTSTRGGAPIAATLTVQVLMFGVRLGAESFDFAAGEAHTFGPFNIFPGWAQAGLAGDIVGNLLTPTEAVIATDSVAVRVLDALFAIQVEITVLLDPLVVGESGIIRFLTTNWSTLDDDARTHLQATIQTDITAVVDGQNLMNPFSSTDVLDWSRSELWDLPIIVPAGTGEQTAVIDAIASVLFPKQVSNAGSLSVTKVVTSAEIDYGGTITIG